MKFSCDRCGKRYATADEPVPGRAYRLKCKACGHLVVVRVAARIAAPAAAPEPNPAVAQEACATAEPEPTPPAVALEPIPDAPEPSPAVEPEPTFAADAEPAPAIAPEASPASEQEPTPAVAPEVWPPELLERTPAPRPEPTEQAASEPTTTIAFLDAPESRSPTPAPLAEVSATSEAPHAAAGGGIYVQRKTMERFLDGDGSAVPPEDEEAAPGRDARYVDLFGERGEARGTITEDGAPEDRFLAAARGSLPAGFSGGSAEDPLARLRAELEWAARGETTPPPDASPRITASKVHDLPRPPAQRHGGPAAVIGAGVLVLLAILAFALFGPGTAALDPPPAAVPSPAVAEPVRLAPRVPLASGHEPRMALASAHEPVQEPAPALPASPSTATATPSPFVAATAVPAPPAAPATAAAATAATAAANQRAPAAKRTPQPPREERRRRVTRPAAPKPPPAPAARAQVASASSAAPVRRQKPRVHPPTSRPSEQQLQQVRAAAQEAFDGCIASTGRRSRVKLDGRTVVLRLNVQPSGKVTYPTIDDVTLSSTELGACLKSASRRMVFPRFEGDPLRVDVPLQLARR